MKRLLLDTNIYGLLFTSGEFHVLHQKLEGSRTFLVYGLDVIRRELKSAPKKKIGGVNVQASLLRAYSSFVHKEYETVASFADLAEEYFSHYSSAGGGFTKGKLMSDFLIVACASIKSMNVVVSEDNATMLNEIARSAYKEVNAQRGIQLPQFIGFNKFKEILLGTGFSNPVVDSSKKFWVLLGFFNVLPLVFHKGLQETLIYKLFVPQ